MIVQYTREAGRTQAGVTSARLLARSAISTNRVTAQFEQIQTSLSGVAFGTTAAESRIIPDTLSLNTTGIGLLQLLEGCRLLVIQYVVILLFYFKIFLVDSYSKVVLLF